MFEKIKRPGSGDVIKYGCWFIIGVLAILAFISFVKAPFTGDIEVFIAAENQVHHKEVDGLKALFEAWELKGIANRTLMYGLYRIANLFVPYGYVVDFELVVKLLYAIIAIVFFLLTALVLGKNRTEQIIIFFVEYFGGCKNFCVFRKLSPH